MRIWLDKEGPCEGRREGKEISAKVEHRQEYSVCKKAGTPAALSVIGGFRESPAHLGFGGVSVIPEAAQGREARKNTIRYVFFKILHKSHSGLFF